jgi:type IV pilus biogenesis protein CpaD/CtpE
MKSLSILTILLITSCATKITPQGKKIQIATDSQKEKYCKMIDIISVSNGNGWGAEDNQTNAMNEVRNKAAQMGGNAIRIISSNYVAKENSSRAIIQAEALKCNFPK